jgi:hypothetical protein
MKLINFLKDRLRIRGKIIFGAIGAAFLLFLGSPHPAYALLGIGNISTGVVSVFAQVIAYILAWIFGAVIAVEAWFIGVVLNINAGIMQTSFVQTGFSVSLSVANLAFVLGIIVIALATILRIENYSIKKMLWKLVVMAILVNFGLVIISPIFALSNTFTQYFLNSLPGGGSGTSLNSFGQTMASKFNPGAMFAPVANPTQGTGSNLAPLGLPATGDVPVGATMVPIFSLIFTILDFILIVFVLGAFIVMLMIRYIYIAILAILLPFAWAAWVFPSFSSMFSKWWNKFLQWTFFAPIFMFFLYLALATIGGSNNADALNNTDYTGAGNTTFAAIMNFFGSGFRPIITNFLQEMVLAGLIIGGMIAADSMGVKFAGATVDFAKKQGKTFATKRYDAAKRRAGEAFRSMGRKTDEKGETTTWLQRQGSRFQGVPLPFAKTVGSKFAAAGSPEVGKEDRIKDVDKYVEENLKGLTNEGILARAHGTNAMTSDRELAALGQELSKRNLTAAPTATTPGLDPAKLAEFIKSAEKMGSVQSILSNRPELAAQTAAATPRMLPTGVMENMAQAIERAIGDATKKIKISDVPLIDSRSLGDLTKPAGLPPTHEQETIAISMSIPQLNKLATEGGPGAAAAYKDTIQRMVNAATAPGAPALPPAILAKLNQLDNYTTTSPGWIYI